jgi:hypothetical protein
MHLASGQGTGAMKRACPAKGIDRVGGTGVRQMMNGLSFLRRIVQRTIILAGLAGLMFVAGIDWAQAATREAGNAMPSELHVVLLFLATIAFVIRAVMPSRKPVPAKAPRRARR